MKNTANDTANSLYDRDCTVRKRLAVEGLVQGVGFRPSVYRLAAELKLSGWVRNTGQGVQVEIEGKARLLDEFVTRLDQAKPPRSRIDKLEISILPVEGATGFSIRQSGTGGEQSALVLPDIATCDDCAREIFDPDDRRFRYPFTNCTNCGPRFSIIESLPYDRSNTTMRAFTMCDLCRHEYENPFNRRFHAQPNACPQCGPHLELWKRHGDVLTTRDEALLAACHAVRAGKIVALKGLGGFQLIVDAANSEAIDRLRHMKARAHKPFALMYPDLDTVKRHCQVSEAEKKLLVSPRSPIVLLRQRNEADRKPPLVSSRVAPDNPYLGIMLPYTPLHHLLMSELGCPMVATSGNLRDEPICIDEQDALDRLGGIADLFLVYNRPITRQMDDSIVRLATGREMVLRNARGYAPVAVPLEDAGMQRLAVGAHLKNSVAVSNGSHAFVSQYIGDLTTRQAVTAFDRTVRSASALFSIHPTHVLRDKHPDYHSSRYANALNLPIEHVQHHYAHVLSCMADNGLNAPVFGVSWDGTGLGLDGTIWGGEFLSISEISFSRIAHLRTFRLPGNEKAITEPRRAALGLLYEMFGEDLFSHKTLRPIQSLSDTERNLFPRILSQKVNAPVTSSAGRLFDAVASIVGLCQVADYEGQAAMMLEFAAIDTVTEDFYIYDVIRSESSYSINWEPMIRTILDDMRWSLPVEQIAAKFHNTLAEMIVGIAERVGEKKVVLSGGCFQNKYLLERAVRRLREVGLLPYWHKRIPPNDGGIALGQIVAASRRQPKGD